MLWMRRPVFLVAAVVSTLSGLLTHFPDPFCPDGFESAGSGIGCRLSSIKIAYIVTSVLLSRQRHLTFGKLQQ
jgi:hypothetical protein